ncbi:Predicted P-loop ATPase, KAP-like [Pseudomonas sp. 8Z]|uniref:KAP family P-loop NTPase fold protein n=1 Tax=Pseudomonas sp. 8Z TaxID=2653166 RepID=UPI0012F12B94|nr:P-loop NTPase fold protein [Pseudomonas sp. 8Z]VXC94674.1 Predicted P-loop ATPase, KAP-like [Pseudomonas sp. 8Z]
MDDLGFADDRPIEAHDQDLLGRSTFAKNLAAAIAGWKNKESLVIALTGAWGSGKSSIKNLAIQEFAANPSHEVIEYNPWEWTGQEKLSSSFFNEVSLAIKRKDKSEDGKQLAKVLRQYGRKLSAGAVLMEGFAKYLPLFLGSALVTSYLSVWAENPVAQTVMAVLSGGSALAASAAALKRLARFLSDRAEGLDQSAKENELTLSEIRGEIRTLLAKREHPLLIVMDDIDRLSPDQMKALFQLVKGNMDFPNVVFLLLFQRDIVEQGLELAGFKGAEYLEKIIQAPFSVPALSTERLEAVLFERLDAILTNEPQLAGKFDTDYWTGVYRKGLSQFFHNLRDVYRYTSTLAFHCRLLRGADVAEINAVDLFALECLRTFAPASYDAMPQHKVALTGSGLLMRQDQTEKGRITDIVQSIVALAPQDYRSGAEQIIKQLFPTLDWVFKNTTYDGSTHGRWLRESRVCRVETFDRYFELALPISEVSNSLLHSLTLLLPDSERFCDILRNQNESQQKTVLERLESYVDDFPLEQSSAVVETLLNVGEVVSGRESSITSLSPPVQAFRLLRFFLLRHDDPATRSGLLLRAFENAKGYLVLERLLSLEASSRREAKPTDLDDAGFEQLKLMFVTDLLAQANHNPEAFIAHWNFISFVHRLNYFADGAGSQWIKQQVTTLERFVLFAEAAVNKGTSYGGNGPSAFYFVRIATLDELLGIETCQGWIEKIQRAELTEPARQAIDLVEDALGRHQRGEKSDYD